MSEEAPSLISAEPPAPAAARGEVEPSGMRGHLARVARATAFGMLLALLALVPLPLGSNRPLAWALFSVAAAVILLFAAISAPARPARPLPGMLLPSTLAVAVVAGWIVLQATPGVLPPTWNHPLWTEVAAIGLDVRPTVSLAPDLTSERLILLLAYVAVFGATLLLVSDPGRARALLGVLLAVGVGYALWGLVVQLGRLEWMLPGVKRLQLGRLHATFVNPNHYATYAVFGVLTALALLVERFRRRVDGGRLGSVLAGLVDALTDRVGTALTGSLLVLVAALLWTGSRGGLLALLAGALTLVLVVVARARPAVSASVLVLLALGGWMALALFGDTMAERLAGIGDEVAAGGGRAAIYALAFRLIGERPWLGFGYGTFERTFTMARDPRFPVVFDHAESSWLELAVDLGLPAATLFAAGCLLLAVILLRGAIRRRRDRAFPLVALAVAVAAGVHGLVDFSPQIPAVAATLAAMTAVGVAHAEPLRHRSADASSSGWLLVRLGGTALGVSLLVVAVPYAQATWQLAAGRSAFELVESGKPVLPEVLARARISREAALAVRPTGIVRKELGVVELHRALDPTVPAEQRRAALHSAWTHLRAGLARDPADPDGWYRLALVETMRGRIAEAASALRLSWRTGPWDPVLAPARLRLALLHWPHLPRETRELAGVELCTVSHLRERLKAWATEVGLSKDAARVLSRAECSEHSRSTES